MAGKFSEKGNEKLKARYEYFVVDVYILIPFTSCNGYLIWNLPKHVSKVTLKRQELAPICLVRNPINGALP